MGLTKTESVRDSPRSLVQLAGVVLALCVGWVLLSAATVVRYLPYHAFAVLVAGVIVVAVIFTAAYRLIRRGADVPLWFVYLPVALIVLAYFMVYPKTQHLGPGRGSDREDALRVELQAVQHGLYPYSVHTYRGDLPTPLPGAMLLAAPFYRMGRVSLQNPVWAMLFAVAVGRMFRRSATTAAVLLVCLPLALEGLNDFVAGGDYVVNAMYVAVAVFLVERALRSNDVTTPRMSWGCWIVFAFLGICLCSRVCYLPVLLPVLALARQRVGWKRAIAFGAATLCVIAAVSLPVFWPHPLAKMLAYSNQIPGKLRYLPTWISPIGVMAVSIVAAAGSFAFRMSLRRVYLVIAVSTMALVTPPMVALVAAQTRQGLPLNHQMVYFTVPAIFLRFGPRDGLRSRRCSPARTDHLAFRCRAQVIKTCHPERSEGPASCPKQRCSYGQTAGPSWLRSSG